MRDLAIERNSGKLKNFLRMSTTDFEFLLNQISPRIQKQDTHLRKAISPTQRFVITLRYLASGDSFEELSYVSRSSPQAISGIVIDVCQALIDLLVDFVRVSLNSTMIM